MCIFNVRRSLAILAISNNMLCAPTGAFDALCDNLNSPTFESAVGANDEEIDFLSKLMNSTVLQSLIQVSHMVWNQPINSSVTISCLIRYIFITAKHISMLQLLLMRLLELIVIILY